MTGVQTCALPICFPVTIGWSKAIEYDADMAMAIHRYPGTNMIEVVSRKNRHGHEFDFYLDWDINRGIIKPIYENLPDMKGGNA